MVRVTLRQLLRFSQARRFGGPNIAGKVNKELPGLDWESMKHNYSVTPMFAFLSLAGVILGWYVYVLMHPKEMMHQERSTTPESEKMAKGFFGMYHSNKDVPPVLSPNVERK